jgi:hypothetical protein
METVDMKKFSEKKEIEQYFFTENVLSNLVEALTYEDDILCLCTPAVADAFHRLKERTVACLDIDDRFNYLPGYMSYDVLNPVEIEFKPKVIIIDPPFFGIGLPDLYKAVECITKGDKSTKILFAFVQREEKSLLFAFKSYGLKATKFKLEYVSVDPTKWDNYALYSNYEFNKIKFYKSRK